jgi:hypothetical protein
MTTPENIIIKLSEEDRLNAHVPDWAFELSQSHNVFYRDLKTGELIQIFDLRGAHVRVRNKSAHR